MLISRHAPSVFSVTTRMLGRAADAEDVAQDTFVSAYKALPRFQFESKFSTWLYRIAVNKCTDVLRARRPGHVSLDSPEQGANGIPVAGIKRDGQKVSMDVQAVAATYEAQLAADGKSMTGTWSQPGGSLPLVVTKQ